MIHLTLETVTDLAFNFIFYFIIGSFGAFLKDLYETLTKKNEQIRLGEVLIGGVSATFICLALRDFSWFEYRSLGFMSLVAFITGIIGFEIFGNLTTLTKLRRFISILQQMKDIPPAEWDKHSDQSKLEGDEKQSGVDNDNEETLEVVEPTKKKKRKKEEDT